MFIKSSHRLIGWFIQPFHISITVKPATQHLKLSPTSKARLNHMTNKMPPLLEYLEKKDITLKSLIQAALEMYVPHPGVENEEKASRMLEAELLDILTDVNVSTLIVAAFHAQEEAENGRIPGLTKDRFMGRPGLVADELIGIAIATYIGGSKGMFEFVRFDQAKPGILKKLPPLTNDAIGALVAGASSNVYTRALKSVDNRQ
jgi:alpha-ribazole phosphatase CobZ